MSTAPDHERQPATVTTARGQASVGDTGGDAPVAVFVHGLGTSSTLWRNLVPLVGADRRCVAPDLPLHGGTPLAPEHPVSLRALADFVLATLDAMGVEGYDLVANDT